MGLTRTPITRNRKFARGIALVGAAVLTSSLSLAPASGSAAVMTVKQAPKQVSTDEPGVTANLFEWNWSSVGAECTDVLGPAGYSGVQVAPPQNSMKRIKLGDGSDTVLHPWWEVYQPVTYDLTSRMGSERQFKRMVKTCRKAGVKVYVDTVINHMTGQGSTSYGGQNFTPYNYENYGPGDFHFNAGECPSSDGGIQDFNNRQQVFNCNLVGLEDLRTQTPKVQAELAGYLNKLIRYGVSGFRVDAAKHIDPEDLDAIYDRLYLTKDRTKPYWALEVFGGGPGILSPQAFTKHGDVLGLDGVKQIRDAFKSYPDEHIGSIATLEVFGADSGLTKSSKTLSFVQNHDTERSGDALNYKDGATNILATQWLLASGYGSPQVYAGFTFETRDDSPPARPNGKITRTDCSSAAWSCTDRNPGVLAMVGWHNYAGQAKRRNWFSDDANVIAFSKGRRTWAAFNNGTEAKAIHVQTGLAKGRYCDIIHGQRTGATCSGPVVVVNSTGFADVTVGAKDSVAFKRTDRLPIAV